MNTEEKRAQKHCWYNDCLKDEFHYGRSILLYSLWPKPMRLPAVVALMK
jgi:hypothetical protein